jgi:signal transduction histidine kinase
MKGRSGSITVEVGQDDQSGTIRVIDDGPGISTDIMSTLFEPGITTKTGGWGIGPRSRGALSGLAGGRLIENPQPAPAS